MMEFCRYLTWQRDAVILILGVLEMVVQISTASASSSTLAALKPSPSSVHYKTSGVDTSQPYTTGFYTTGFYTTDIYTTGIYTTPLTPSFSTTKLAYSFSTSKTSESSDMASSFKGKLQASYSDISPALITTSSFAFNSISYNLLKTDHSSSSNLPLILHSSDLSPTSGFSITTVSSLDDGASSLSAMPLTTSASIDSSIFLFRPSAFTTNIVASSLKTSVLIHSSETLPTHLSASTIDPALSAMPDISIVSTSTQVKQTGALQTTNLKSGNTVSWTVYSSPPSHPMVMSQNIFSDISSGTASNALSTPILSEYSSFVQQTTIYSTDMSASSPPALSSSATTTVISASPVHYLATTAMTNWQPTPKPSMVIKPPPLRTVTSPTATHAQQRCQTGSCCTYGLSQLPPHITFEESSTQGFVLAEVKGIVNVNFTVKVSNPPELTSLLKESFNITSSGNVYKLVLNQEVDLEELYDITDGKIDVHSLQIQITCSENSSIIVPPRLLNVTIEDVDDCMPVFSTPGASSDDCVVPVYRADTSEDYMGELALSPGKIEATDGDVSSRHNISYRVLHSEPEDYHVYFNVDGENGTVHKTKSMNSSDPSKYVLFVQAVEDSPQQKSRVAVLSIVVVAPRDPLKDEHKADPTARLALQITCAFVLMAFICGFVVIIHHRYTVSRTKVDSWQNDVEQDMKVPKLAVYQSSSSSLNSAIPDVPTVSSPSQVVVASDNTLKPESRLSESQRKRRLIVKKPLDTKSRPGWNAPAPKPKRSNYNPFSVYQKTYTK